MKLKSTKSSKKKKVEMKPELVIKKKLRSNLTRRRRSEISPVVVRRPFDKDAALSVDSISSSHSGGGISCCSSRVSNSQKRRLTTTRGNDDEESEVSCVDSNFLADFRVTVGSKNSRKKKASENAKEFEINDAVCLGAATRSDISCIEQIPARMSSVSNDNDAVSLTSGVEFLSDPKLNTEAESRGAAKHDFSEISRNDVVDANFCVSNSGTIVDQERKGGFVLDSSALACTEQLSYDDVADCSSSQETAFPELQSDLFPESSYFDLLDSTPSIFLDSGSEFSERSDDGSAPSITHSLFLEFKQQFSRSAVSFDSSSNSSEIAESDQWNLTSSKFDNEEDEESYKSLRERERRQAYLRNFGDDLPSSNEYGDLVLRQRSFMLHWIVDQCKAKELQQETLFLGASLLDRFLSKGFFKSENCLQIVAISCLALATRIEENQPYNSVRQSNFKVGSNTYGRCEVVAMEWLVQEVLNFQCFLPTVYNFLWFYLKAANATADMEKRARHLAVLSLWDNELLHYWPSTVAAALVMLTCIESNQNSPYERVIEVHMRSKDDDLPECIKKLF